MSLLFTKEPPSLDFLQAGFVHSSIKENKILYFTEIALYNLYQHFVMMKGSTPHNLFNCYFYNSCIYANNYDTKCKLSNMTNAVSCLVERPKNVQGHTF